MKAMTCKPLGGPCDQEHHGDTADETIRSQDQHLKDAVASGDDVHRAAHDDMTWRWRRPISGMRRYRRTKQAVADLPERQ